MNPPQYAVCDIGTNSVRLMLADRDRLPVEKRLITTRIGDKLHRTGLLSRGGIERTLSAISEYARTASSFGLPLYAFATSAVRDAANRDDFLRLARQCGIDIDVVDGETEGMLGFLGVGAKGPARLIDIGGGSTELAYGTGGKVQTSFSTPVGCVRALERYGDSPDGPHLVGKWLRETNVTIGGKTMTTAEAAALFPKSAPVYAVSGTATSIASFVAGATTRYDGSAIDGLTVTKAQIAKVFSELSALTPNERCAIPVLGKRGDLILLGAALLTECMDMLGTDEITTSDSDNMDGYLAAKLDGLL